MIMANDLNTITNTNFTTNPNLKTRLSRNLFLSQSSRGNAVTIKKALESSFLGLRVTLENYPPTLLKQLLSKVVTVAQVGVAGTIIAGENILPRLGITTTPPWYHSLCANKFRTLASAWMFGNFAHSSLQSTGAFEVSCNGRLVFSKLKEQRFPAETELKDLMGKALNVLESSL